MILFLKILTHVIGALAAFIPAAATKWTSRQRDLRGGTLFGAHVPAAFIESVEGQAIFKEYRQRIWTWSALVAAASFLLPVSLAALPGPFLGSLICAVAYALANRRTLRETEAVPPNTLRVASLHNGEDAEPWWLNAVDLAAMLVPPLIPLVTLAILAWRWDQFSTRLDDGMRTFPVIFGFAMGLMCTANHWALRYRARSSDWAPSPAESHKYRTCQGALLSFVFTFIISQLCALELMRFVFQANMSAYFWVLFPAHALWMFGVWRLRKWLTNHFSPDRVNRMPDAWRKWGLFYYNPGDPALMVPGSPNWARPSVWMVYAPVMALTVVSLVQTVEGMLRRSF
jgi:hypothetical protein